MSTIKLTYFPITGLAEAIRLTLTVGGIEFEDERLTGEEFEERKKTGELPYGQLPVLTVDGVSYAQSNAILRYVGGMTGLYPKDNAKLSLRIDGVMDAVQDAVISCFWDKTEEGRKLFVEEKVPKFFGPMDRIIKENGGPFLFGDDMTVADLKLSTAVRMIAGDTPIEHVPKDVLDQYENIQSLVKAVGENEKVAAWNKAHE